MPQPGHETPKNRTEGQGSRCSCNQCTKPFQTVSNSIRKNHKKTGIIPEDDSCIKSLTDNRLLLYKTNAALGLIIGYGNNVLSAYQCTYIQAGFTTRKLCLLYLTASHIKDGSSICFCTGIAQL